MIYEVNAPVAVVLARTKGIKKAGLCLIEKPLIEIFVESVWVGLGGSIVF